MSQDPEPYVSDRHVLVNALGDHPKVRLLAAFLGDPERDYNVTELARDADLKRATVYKYLDDLREWRLIEETRTVGNSQMYQIDTDSDATAALVKFEWELVEELAEREQDHQSIEA